ncbi:MAG: hypothetical protein BGO49_22440 [Planctomycetales bacterium 71-10]|nr:MAG: hypothetical protein BGO49_22440 [Planctomycetales bacterium 71-10]
MSHAEFDRRTFLGMTAGAMGWAVSGFAQPAAGRPPLPGRPGFSFLHSYESTGRYWKGIQKAGLVRPTNGVRLVHSPFGDEDDRRFNAVAAVGGPLHALLRERRSWFVVDRVAGGAPYHAYDFDQALIDEYVKLLGDRFLGGQVHEVLSNTHNDWGRFQRADAEKAARPIDPADYRAYFDWSDQSRWLEYGTLDDYRGRTRPGDERAFWAEAEHAARRQGGRFGGRFSYAEGTGHGELAWPAFYRFGAASCFVEVGPWASSQTQFAIASARGAARAAGRPWGVFYAPWGPVGCTSWVEPSESSWRAPRASLDASGWPVGPDKGPSSAFQRRTFFHAYLSGAYTLHEEWGAEDNLSDIDAGVLSSYGKVTRDLLDFQDANPDVGEPFTPIALVVEAILPPAAGAVAGVKAALFAPSDFDRARAARPSANKAEADCYPPMTLPEVFDVVPGDAPAALLEGYAAVIPAGAADAAGRLREAVDRLCPFRRASTLPMQVNRRASDGAWILALYNPWGATRGDVERTGSVLDPECLQSDVIAAAAGVNSLRVLHAWPEGTGAKREGAGIACEVGPGGTLILEVRLDD